MSSKFALNAHQPPTSLHFCSTKDPVCSRLAAPPTPRKCPQTSAFLPMAGQNGYRRRPLPTATFSLFRYHISPLSWTRATDGNERWNKVESEVSTDQKGNCLSCLWKIYSCGRHSLSRDTWDKCVQQASSVKELRGLREVCAE